MNAALGIDTSNYVTSCALVGEDLNLIAERREPLPVPPGSTGLRQSEAFFEHVRRFPGLFSRLLAASPEARIRAVAVSDRPSDREGSYMPVFLAGTSFAESLSSALGVPCLRTTHQRGHIAAAAYGGEPLPSAFLCLHLSGGTTQLLRWEDGAGPRVLSSARDLHAGQLIDRVGVLLGGPFPAGPWLEALAEEERATGRYPARVTEAGCHFSGAEAQAIRDQAAGRLNPAQIAAEVFDMVARTVVKMLTAGAEETGLSLALVTGGVASSGLLRKLLEHRLRQRRLPLRLRFGQPRLSSDNAVGVALLGARLFGGTHREEVS